MRKLIVFTVAALFVAAACPVPAESKGKPKASEIPVTKTYDKSSPTLMRSTAPRDSATGQASGKRQHGR